MPQDFAAVLAAIVDGRTHTIFHRQVQLEKLHQALRQEASALREAAQADGNSTPAEAATEYYAAMRCVTNAYHFLRPQQALEEEYAVAKGKDAPSHQQPAGIVYIEPTRHTTLFSVLSPLSSAIAAGNCVVLLLPRNLRAMNAELRRILITTLESETFAIAEEPVTTELPTEKTVYVLQNNDERVPKYNQLVSAPSAHVVAIIDRAADLQLAAHELVTARFTYGGHSPYAPDLVLVNEFIRKDFLHAVLQECVGYGSVDHGPRGAKDSMKSTAAVKAALESLRKSDLSLRVIADEHLCAVVEAPSRESLLHTRLKASVLVIHSIRSLDDGIDLITHLSQAPCAATYHFGTPETCKYLCQFVPSAASFVNHVPRELLLGPGNPRNQTLDLANRYPPSLFTVSRPQYIHPTAESARLAAALATTSGAVAQKIAAQAAQQLVLMKRHDVSSVGFFEQGFLLNVGLTLTGVAALASIGGAFYLKMRA